MKRSHKYISKLIGIFKYLVKNATEGNIERRGGRARPRGYKNIDHTDKRESKCGVPNTRRYKKGLQQRSMQGATPT